MIILDQAAFDQLAATLGSAERGVVVQIFLDQVEARRTTLESAAAEPLRELAHVVRSTAELLGLRALADAAARTEQVLRTEPETADLEELRSDLLLKFDQAVDALRSWQQTHRE